jgi:hypothetical protein
MAEEVATGTGIDGGMAGLVGGFAASMERGRETEMGHGAFEHGWASSFLVFSFFLFFFHLFLIFGFAGAMVSGLQIGFFLVL